MDLPRSRSLWVRWAAFGGAALVVLAVLCLQLYAENVSYRRSAANSRVRALQELAESLDKVDTDLQKCLCSSSAGMISALCTQIYGETTAAAQTVGELPYADLQLENTTRFLNQTGSYAQALSKSVATHGGYSGSELSDLRALSDAAGTLSAALDELANQLCDGTTDLEDVAAVERRLSALTEDQPLFTGGSFEAIEADFPELPTLIYDGPFSQHLQSKEAKLLQNAAEITAEEAKNAAAEFLRTKPAALIRCSDVEGELPCYVFQEGREEGGRIVHVTKKGGYVLSLSDSYEAQLPQLSREEGVKQAKKFLKERNFPHMQESYSIQRDNCLTVNFAFAQEGVVCYSDLVKVKLALDTGRIVGFESAGYLMNHCERSDLTPKVTEKEAKAAVSPLLVQESCRLALIPTKGEYERLCWEVACRTEEGQHCLVYVNAESGDEEQILLLLEDESGVLTV